MHYLSLILIVLAVIFETVADIFFKKWSIDHKHIILYSGLVLYGIGTALWAYSLNFSYLSKAITVFTVLNLIAVILVGIFFFDEKISTVGLVGIVLGVVSVLLLQL